MQRTVTRVRDSGRWLGGRRAVRLAGVGLLVLVVALGIGFAYRGVTDGGVRAFDGDDEAGAPGIAQLPADMAETRPAEDGFAYPEKGGALSSAGAAPSVASEPGLPTGGGSAFQFMGRDIIRSGSMELEVDSVAAAFSRVTAVATSAGGMVADSTFYGSGEEQYAQLTLRVPAERFDAVVEELRGVAVEVRSLSTSSQDVTGQVTDLQSQLRNLRAVELRYLDLLAEATAIGDILQVHDRLDQVRMEIERIEGQVQMLERLTEMATLSVSLGPEGLAPEPLTGGGLREAAQDAWQASLESLETVATFVVVVAVYSWWLLPLLVLAAVVARRMLRGVPARPAQPAE